MRKLVGALLLVAVPLHLILGALFVLSSRYRAVAAEIESQDLSAVAGDLASPAELAKEHKAAERRLKGGRGGAQLAVGIALLAGALLQLVAGILALLGRGFVLIMTAVAISIGGAIVAAITDGFSLLGVACPVPILLAWVLALVGQRRWTAPREQPAEPA